jgi:cobalt transporter subunit CbtA
MLRRLLLAGIGAGLLAALVVSLVVVGTGFGLVLVAAFALRGEAPGLRRGAVWGLLGFVAFALSPALGLPPELPGSAAAELSTRQLWWLGAVAVTAAGLWLLAFGGRRAWLGLLLLPLPHLIGAPRPDGHGGMVPAELAAQFVAASLVTSAIFWAVLGSAAGWLAARLARGEKCEANPRAAVPAREKIPVEPERA